MVGTGSDQYNITIILNKEYDFVYAIIILLIIILILMK